MKRRGNSTVKINHIGDLFEKYRLRIKAPQGSVRKEALSVIVELTGFPITLEQLEYTVSTRTLVLRVPSILRSEIMFKQSDILRLLQDRLGVESAPKTIL